MTQSNVRAAFERHFNTHGTLYASAGRINLIGEHTDYNGGFVFPGAVDCGITAMIRPNGTDRVRAYAVDLDSYAEFDLREEDKPAESWARYIFGVCREIQKRGGRIGGFDTAFSGDVPLGAGMSSSAALESTFAFALNDLYALGIDKFELARIGQSTEHNYCGVKCGIMDQFASVFGKKGCLMRLDCRSMEFEYFPFDPVGYKLVLLDTVVKHELVGSPYNRRRESCERVAKMLGQEFLRGATMERLDAIRDEISDEDYRRARFVIGEERRVLDVCKAWRLRHRRRADVRHARGVVEGLRSIVRGARLPGRRGPRMRRHGGTHDGRRLRRLHDQPREGRPLRRFHRHGQTQIHRAVRPRTQSLSRRHLGRRT